EGVVILSTCNRVEIYLSPSRHTEPDELRNTFAEICNLTFDEAEATYMKRDGEAAAHLFRVASGLDSQLLGEVQILTQVKNAYHAALELTCTNNVLNALFLRAIECGKLVRHRTAISQGAASVAYAAADVAQRVFHEFSECRVLLVGAGETVRLASKYLADAGVVNWKISNRTIENAQALAETLGGNTTAFPPQAEDLAWADLIVSATSSPTSVITDDVVTTAVQHRSRPLLVLDLAVPRDVDERASRFDNVYVYSVDDFKEMVRANLKAREKEAVRAEKLVEKQTEEFAQWYRENRVAPTIQQLAVVLEGIRVHEVQTNVKRFTPENHHQVDEFSKSLIRKVTSLIVSNMKRASLDRDDLSLARAVAQAFASDNESNINQILEKLDHELSH
ncbi:MAG: glutamyl-tRNA reductase, partial [Calditrichota bacterium]